VRVKTVSRGPLFPADGSWRSRLQRRTRGILLEIVLFVLLTLLSPLVLVAALLVDLALWLVRRKPWMAVRLAAMAWWFLFGEMRGMLGLMGIYVATGGPFGRGSRTRARLVYRVRIHWCRSNLAGVRVLLGLSFEVEGLELAGPGPEIVFMRHASIIDNTLPDALIGHAHGLGLRFVLKRELEMLPVFDIGARWVPTAFVRRASSDPVGEAETLRKLARELGDDEGVLI